MSNIFFTNKAEIDTWLSKTTGNLLIANEYFMNNSSIILQQDTNFFNQFINCITGPIRILPIVRKKSSKEYQGINIEYFNKSLRSKLLCCNDLLFEVYNDEGVFFSSNSTKGFDFGKFDREYNLINLRNLCFGRRSLYNGQNYWDDCIKKNKFLQELYNKNETILSYPEGYDAPNTKKSLTILGELQFGNWGLAYRDFFKLLQADNYSGVDLFVYVTATNNLLSYSSDGIVSFESTVKILEEFSNLIKIPIWVIGLDIEAN
jgi:hypothetical protein